MTTREFMEACEKDRKMLEEMIATLATAATTINSRLVETVTYKKSILEFRHMQNSQLLEVAKHYHLVEDEDGKEK